MNDQEFMELFNSGVDEKSKSREYHFKKMHVYVNALFRNDPTVENRYIHFPLDGRFAADHHCHIFVYNVNTDTETLYHMANFIRSVSTIIKRPVYIHMPKKAKRSYMRISAFLKHVSFHDELRYEFIIEKNNNKVEFNHGNYVRVEDKPISVYTNTFFPNAKMYIGWSDWEYATISFYSTRRKGRVPVDEWVHIFKH